MTDFAVRYADQNERDHQVLLAGAVGSAGSRPRARKWPKAMSDGQAAAELRLDFAKLIPLSLS